MKRIRVELTTKLFLLVLVAVSLTVIAVKLLTRSPNVSDAAVTISTAVIGMDADEVANWLLPEELNQLDWTKERAKQLLNEVVLPKFRGCELVGIKNKGIRNNGALGVADIRIRFGDGSEYIMFSTANQTDHGPRVTLTHLLQEAWIVDYIRSKPKTPKNEWGIRAVKTGLVRDGESLRRLGFNRFMPPSAGKPGKSLDQAIADAKDWLEKHP